MEATDPKKSNAVWVLWSPWKGVAVFLPWKGMAMFPSKSQIASLPFPSCLTWNFAFVLHLVLLHTRRMWCRHSHDEDDNSFYAGSSWRDLLRSPMLRLTCGSFSGPNSSAMMLALTMRSGTPHPEQALAPERAFGSRPPRLCGHRDVGLARRPLWRRRCEGGRGRVGCRDGCQHGNPHGCCYWGVDLSFHSVTESPKMRGLFFKIISGDSHQSENTQTQHI
jgi:hypothetical protein